ncbi:Uncharacterised protein [Serratia fonticola]|uniref:Uncharacterized protein n=1 Tax=Serratia fonticola TaxID=47917 RepID=A0A448SZH9_SERFO|nr:Uncharacterised protein [Serratia fonticola]
MDLAFCSKQPDGIVTTRALAADHWLRLASERLKKFIDLSLRGDAEPGQTARLFISIV